jgi:hypothetical protein
MVTGKAVDRVTGYRCRKIDATTNGRKKEKLGYSSINTESVDLLLIGGCIIQYLSPNPG